MVFILVYFDSVLIFFSAGEKGGSHKTPLGTMCVVLSLWPKRVLWESLLWASEAFSLSSF